MAGRLKHVNAAVIGLGVGRGHLNDYAKHPGCTIAAICDADPERLARTAKDFGLDASRCFGSIDALLHGRPPLAPAAHGLRVQKVLDGIYRSAARGKEVRIG